MLRKLFLLPLLFSPLVVGDSVDVSATVTQPDPNTYCVSGVCLSINGGSTTTPAPDNGPTIGFGPTQTPGEPGTVIVQKPPTCDSCEAGVLVFYMQPTCCPDGSVCDIGGLLSSGPLEFPTDCGAQGNAAITFNACTCTFYCNSTLGNGGAPTQPPTLPPTVAPTTVTPTTLAPTTVAPTTPAPTTVAPTTQAPTTKAPTQAPTTKAPTTAPTTLVPTRANNPTQPPATTAPPSTCSRCNATHVFFVVFPICCTNQIISTCNNNQIANAAKHLPDNCDENSITWDGCSCTFYCNATSATVPVNPNRPGNAQVLPVPQNEIPTEQVNINFNITKPNNNTRCIAGTSICITINSAPSHTVVTFPIIASVIMGLLAML